jgi:hypothetical protein
VNSSPNLTATDSIQLLPEEELALTLDPRNGLLPNPAVNWGTLIATTHRIIKIASNDHSRVSTILPLRLITGIEVVDATRPISRLIQGFGIFALGTVLAIASWNILNVGLISLLMGGIPLIISIYILAGYFFPEQESGIIVSTAGSTIRLPLLTARARSDSLEAVNQLWRLIQHGQQTKIPNGPRRGPSRKLQGPKVTRPSSTSSKRVSRPVRRSPSSSTS